MDELLWPFGLTKIDTSRVSRMCQELEDLEVGLRSWPLQGAHLHPWLDAPYLNAPQDHLIISQAPIVAIVA
jgi:hypothetical protein